MKSLGNLAVSQRLNSGPRGTSSWRASWVSHPRARRVGRHHLVWGLGGHQGVQRVSASVLLLAGALSVTMSRVARTLQSSGARLERRRMIQLHTWYLCVLPLALQSPPPRMSFPDPFPGSTGLNERASSHFPLLARSQGIVQHKTQADIARPNECRD